MPGSINLSLLYAGHTNDLYIKTACGPPRNFRHASTCPRIVRQASGLVLLTPRTFNTPPHGTKPTDMLVSLRLPQFELTFANRTNSLARSSKRTIRHRQLKLYYRLATDSFIRRSFHAVSRYHLSVSGTFQHLSRVAFQLSLTLLLRYRFCGVFSFGGR